LLSKKEAGLFAEGRQVVGLVNPISGDLSTLRPSLLPGLLKSAKWNVNRGNPDLKFFEVGAVFEMSGKKIIENRKLAGVLTGTAAALNWKAPLTPVDIYDAKGLVENLLRKNGIARWNFNAISYSYTTKKTVSVESDNQKLGVLGEIRRDVLEQMDIEQPVFFFELDFDLLYQKTNWQRGFSPVPKFPPITRDIAIVLKDTIDAANVFGEIKRNGGRYLQNLSLFDVYTGKQIDTGHKSLAYRLTFYSTQRTLTDEEVDGQMKLILGALKNIFGARLRE
jgi:phenylalanyl-tRNA synthetase beta chain